jgi:hypothetical protein
MLQRICFVVYNSCLRCKRVVHIATKKQTVAMLWLYCNKLSGCYIAIHIVAIEVCIPNHVFTWAFVIFMIAYNPKSRKSNHGNRGRHKEKLPHRSWSCTRGAVGLAHEVLSLALVPSTHTRGHELGGSE